MTSSSSFAALDRFIAALEYRIQEAIAQASPEEPTTIRCRFQQGRLLVLSEHSETAVTKAERDRHFKALALSMGKSLADLDFPQEMLNGDGEVAVRFYLRKRGTASPYAARSCGWKPTDATAEVIDLAANRKTANRDEAASAVPQGAIVLVPNISDADINLSEDDDIDIALDHNALPSSETDIPHPWSARWTTAVTSIQLREQWQRLTAEWPNLPWRSVGSLAAVGIAIGAIAYSISRPCLFGPCERRQTASDLSQATFAQLENGPTPDKVADAYADIQKAIRLVSAIPPWSPHYDTAQAELLRYRTQLSDLEWIVSAQKSATQASEKSQDPPHPVPLWVEVHLLWQKAVNHLNRVPDDSPLADFAQTKRAEYQTNYEAIGQRLLTEERAEANLNTAMQAGQMAVTQTENATSLTDWLAAQREWDRATQALEHIPKGSLAYGEARSLISDYRSKSIQTRTRVTFEKAGERAYQEAVASAAQAQAAEKGNQWTQAVRYWADAYGQMRQVPKNTLRYAEAQEQLGSYQNSLKQAQGKLKQAVALQTIEDDLQTLCPLAAGICTYSYSSEQIELILREPYDIAIRQSISPPSTQGRLSRSNSVIEETHQLVQRIMQIGNQVQIPISIYDEDRQFIAQYKPEYGGFSKE